jgi:dienelactone hydrolase
VTATVDPLGSGVAVPCSIAPDGGSVLVRTGAGLFSLPLAGGPARCVLESRGVLHAAHVPGSGPMVVEREADDGVELVRLDDQGQAGRLLGPADGFHRLGAVAPDGRTLAFGRAGEGDTLEVCLLNLEDGTVTAVLSEPGRWMPVSFSPDGSTLAVQLMTGRKSETQLVLVDLASGDAWPVSPPGCWASVPSWLPDSSGFFFSTDAESEFRGIARYEMGKRDWSYVVETDWDLQCAIDPSGRRLLVSQNRDGCTAMRFYDPASLRPGAELELPGDGQAGMVMFSTDGDTLVHHFTSDRDPGGILIHDLEGGGYRRHGPDLVAAAVEAEQHRYRSFDGMWIPVLLYRPRGVATAPVVIVCSQAPESQAVRAYNPLVQELVSRGIAVAVPNLRGSTGYGKRYHRLDDNRSRLQPIGDLAYLSVWLADVEGVDASRIALSGTSYGGWQALTALASYPGTFKGAAVISPILDLRTYVATAPEIRRIWLEREFGRLDAFGDLLSEMSPLAAASRVRDPVFMAHAADDPCVPNAEVEAFVEGVRSAGGEIELRSYPSGSHGIRDAEHRADAVHSLMAFLSGMLAPGEAALSQVEGSWPLAESLPR